MRFVYDFSESADVGRELLGGKGAGLAEMTALGIPVPSGFTITTAACVEYMRNAKSFPAGLAEEIQKHLTALEERAGKKLGDPDDPLLVSVRSGAAVSMPGMMDTILNLGLNDEAVEGLARSTGNERFAYDAYRRLVQMYGDVVADLGGERFEDALDRLKDDRGVKQDVELTADDLKGLVARFLVLYREGAGEDFPQDPRVQLERSVSAVFDSWETPRAQVYRRAHAIPDDLGHGGEHRPDGVRQPRRELRDGRLLHARSVDRRARRVRRVPRERAGGGRGRRASARPSRSRAWPRCSRRRTTELIDTLQRLEQHYREMQDVEFTVEEGRLYILQTRGGKRTAGAALRIATDMVDEGLIAREDAIARIEASQLDQLLHPMIDPKATYDVAAKGLNASPGAAKGKIALDADTAEEWGKAGEDVILVRRETTPDDIHGLIQASGVLTAHGGMTSHAAVVARGMGKPCVAGCEALKVDLGSRTITIGEAKLSEGDRLTIDGGTGEVILADVELVPPQINEHFETILGWADEVRRLKVRANADTPEDAAKAREFGAQGIGLCRTEHMFMAEDRLPLVRAMIMASNDAERGEVLAKLLPLQQSDFEGIFEAMAGLPVTIRLLDPPLHEFLPPLEEAETPEMAARIRSLTEANPMLGTRGCRLGLLYPEVYAMQVRAIIRAALAVEEKTGGAPLVEIMHPLVGFAEELHRLRELTLDTASAELEQAERQIDYLVGTMIELPRACLRADEIAEEADFFSFGTNDLTQTTLGFSRDDAEAGFLTRYLEDGVLEANPFSTLDQTGVGDLMKIGIERARTVKPDIKLGICGEHGGDPASVEFCHGIGLDYVSCSPYRVPLARLAAAQAALAEAGVKAVAVGG